MLHIPQVLTKDQVAQIRAMIDAADWIDGNATSGAQSALAKRTVPLPEGSQAARAANRNMAVSMAMPMVITARFAVRMIVPVVVGMPMVMVAAAAGVVMRVGRMARCRCCGHFGRGQCLHVEAQGPDFLGNVACSISATCAARQRQRLICKINLYI